MSITLNMVCGGGGNTDVYALIAATYPSGSICTATNGSIVLTATDQSGFFLFVIPTPTSVPETWTVSCTDGVDSKSKTATISYIGQAIFLTLAYSLVLFENGLSYTGLGTWQNISSCSIDTEIKATTRNASNGNYWSYSDKIDLGSDPLDGFTVLKITMKITQVNSAGNRLVRIGFFNAKPTAGGYDGNLSKIVVATDANVNTEYTTYSLDISNVTSSVYLSGLSIGTWNISKIWLE